MFRDKNSVHFVVLLHANGVEFAEDSEHNLHFWLNLLSFLAWSLPPLIPIILSLNVICVNPSFLTYYETFQYSSSWSLLTSLRKPQKTLTNFYFCWKIDNLEYNRLPHIFHVQDYIEWVNMKVTRRSVIIVFFANVHMVIGCSLQLWKRLRHS